MLDFLKADYATLFVLAAKSHMSTVELYNIEEQRMTAQVSCDSRQSRRSSTVVLLQSD